MVERCSAEPNTEQARTMRNAKAERLSVFVLLHGLRALSLIFSIDRKACCVRGELLVFSISPQIVDSMALP